jgi:hypothetical protein
LFQVHAMSRRWVFHLKRGLAPKCAFFVKMRAIFIVGKLVFGFDPSPEWTLWFYLTHASWARNFYLSQRTGEHFRLHRAGEFRIRWLRPSQILDYKKGLARFLIGNRCFSASWWFWLRHTKAIMHSWFGRLTSHIGTETRSEPLRGAAVKNLGQWTQVWPSENYSMTNAPSFL